MVGNVSEYGLRARRVFFDSGGRYGGITLLYLLKGRVEVLLDGTQHVLAEGRILLVNKGARYEIRGDGDNIVIALEISSQYFARYYSGYFYHKFRLGPGLHPAFKAVYVESVLLLMARVASAEIGAHSEFALLEINRLLSEIMLILVSYFKDEESGEAAEQRRYSRRIENVTAFLNDNFRHDISLRELAEREFVSMAHLSRQFRSEVGTKFSDYLTRLRFESAVFDLLNTDKSVFAVASDNGFSNARQFAALFKSLYHETPAAYRKARQESAPAATAGGPAGNEQNFEEADPHEVAALLSDVLSDAKSYEGADSYTPVSEQRIVLGRKKAGRLPELEHIVHINGLNELLKAQVQRDLLELKKVARVDAVEVWQLTAGAAIQPEFVTDEPSPTYSPYHNAEQAVDFLQKNGIAMHLHVFHRALMHDREGYSATIIKFLERCTALFGAAYLDSWKFFYHAEHDDDPGGAELAEGYAFFRQMLESCLPGGKFGFFHPFSGDFTALFDKFLNGGIAAKADYIGYSASFRELGDVRMLSDKEYAENAASYVQHKTRCLQGRLESRGLKSPLYLLKWNTLTGPTRHSNGSFFRAALIMNTLLDLGGKVRGVGMALNTEIMQETQDLYIKIGGIAPFFVAGGRRPFFFSLYFLQRLRGEIISRTVDHLITGSEAGYQFLFMNQTVFNPSLSMQEFLTQRFQVRRLIRVEGLAPGLYQVRKYVFDQQNGALYKQYERFHTRYGRDAEALEYLARRTTPELSIFDECLDGGDWVTLEELDVNAIHFYEFRRMGDLPPELCPDGENPAHGHGLKK